MTRYAHPFDGPLWSRRQLVLAALLSLAGLAGWWLLRTASEEPPAKRADDGLPDYIVRDFSAVETNDSGRPSRELRAEELRHYPNRDVTELSEPRLKLFKAGDPPWQARARSGTIFDGGDQIRLSGDVQLDRVADAQARPMHLETEQIDIWRAQGLAETDKPVRILSDGDTLKANGMQLWYNEPTYTTFHGRARIQLAPEQEATP